MPFTFNLRSLCRLHVFLIIIMSRGFFFFFFTFFGSRHRPSAFGLRLAISYYLQGKDDKWMVGHYIVFIGREDTRWYIIKRIMWRFDPFFYLHILKARPAN